MISLYGYILGTCTLVIYLREPFIHIIININGNFHSGDNLQQYKFWKRKKFSSLLFGDCYYYCCSCYRYWPEQLLNVPKFTKMSFHWIHKTFCFAFIVFILYCICQLLVYFDTLQHNKVIFFFFFWIEKELADKMTTFTQNYIETKKNRNYSKSFGMIFSS